jgi:F-type H+-transporting ATPase subunit delta
LFELLKANHEKTMDVKISSAFEVSKEQEAMISSALTRKLQRQVVLETRLETELLGGIVVRAEDTVIDDSVRGKLQKLAGLLN